MSSLNPYLAKLEACLGGLPPNAQQAVMEELRDHLEDRAAALRVGGLEEEASMSEAIERFGEAREIGTALRDVHGRGSWSEALAGMVPFLVFGLVMALGEYLVRPVWSPYTIHHYGHHVWMFRMLSEYAARPIWSYSMTVYCFMACYIVLLTGLGVGWVEGFPRWSYPYGGLVLASTCGGWGWSAPECGSSTGRGRGSRCW